MRFSVLGQTQRVPHSTGGARLSSPFVGAYPVD